MDKIKKRIWNTLGGKYPKNWAEVKKEIITRDNESCVMCGENVCYTDSWFTSRPISDFRVHHIDLNKNNNDFNNLIFVCTRCHGKLHYNANRCILKSMPK
jgi:5-methylcytosine-specific restriction endonuclease McrA